MDIDRFVEVQSIFFEVFVVCIAQFGKRSLCLNLQDSN
jgi:hypothetical protein